MNWAMDGVPVQVGQLGGIHSDLLGGSLEPLCHVTLTKKFHPLQKFGRTR